ncbi:MAG TPA: extracellular solute-binding protein [Ideonella sp.]|nr:extracellular solute-binding protein [Ideonella sp.]
MKTVRLVALAVTALCGAAFAQDKTITEWDVQTQAGPAKILQDAATRFEKANPGYRALRSQIPNDAYKTKLKIAFGANEPPCVFMNWGGGALREYVNAGQVVDLTPYLAKEAAFKERFLSNAFDATASGGKVWGIPAEDTSVAVVYYNADLFAKQGLVPPKTWPELLTVVEKLKAQGIAPFALANKAKWPGSMYFMYLVDRLGGPEVFRKASTRAAGGSFADPAFVEAGRKLQELVKAGAFAQGVNGLDYDVGASRRLMYAGKAAMQLMGTWESSSFKNENPEFFKKVDFFAFPTLPGGKGGTGIVGSVGNNFYSISKACKAPDAAWSLIKSFVDDEAVAARLADNRITPVKGLKLSDPNLQRVMKLVGDAPTVQLWYDQELPPQLAELHKDTVQALFGLSMTPEEAAQKMEALAAQVLK